MTRAFPRFALGLPFTLYPAPTEAAQEALRGRMADIGLGGFCGVICGEVNVRQRLAAEFRLPGGELLQIRCIVRHHHDARYGFEFLDINAGQRDHIRQACQNLAIV